MRRLLITGAAGRIGGVLRRRLTGMADILRLSDIADLGEAAPHEELVICDLADAEAVHRMVEGCDGIVHLGGVPTEDRFSRLLRSNIVGLFNLYEAARAHGMPRIVFASSNHTIGYYPQDRRLGPDVPMKPDSLYGVSKCFGENVASLYHDKFGQETALVRIGSCYPKPLNHRMLKTWLSHDDLTSLVQAVFAVPVLGCPVIWGVSANDGAWWDNSHIGFLGWTPKDNGAAYRAEIDAKEALPPADSPLSMWQGGVMTAEPIYDPAE